MQFINTLTVLALVVASFALIVAVPVLYASSEDSGRSNRLILLGSAVWVALVLLNTWIAVSGQAFAVCVQILLSLALWALPQIFHPEGQLPPVGRGRSEAWVPLTS